MKFDGSAYYEDAPLCQALLRHTERPSASFHTPGHKGHCGFLPLRPAFDLTELPDTDSLFECNGAIAEAESRAARLFGAGYSAVSAGGCTLAIQGMLAAFAGFGSKVVFGRNIHRAAINAAALLDLDPVWVLPRNDCGSALPGRIFARDIEAALNENPDAAAVYLTSPDYYGCLSDIASIAAVCREKSVPLLVDNAHGTHLVAFGLHPLTLGATATACSAHKTLPVLTGAAWLNCRTDDRFRMKRKIKESMALFGSTSPSYLTMASLDAARAWMEKDGIPAFRGLADTVAELRRIAVESGFSVPPGECDPVRLTLLTGGAISGHLAADYFRKRGAECEHSDPGAVIFLLTPFNTPKEIALLRKAIEDFPAEIGQFAAGASRVHENAAGIRLKHLPKRAMSPREALASPRENALPVRLSVGRIAAETAAPCPPGVPVIMPGEIIDENCAKILSDSRIVHINVVK
jgi:Arginine/lysine/ornithine decarboxylases